jgi:hypothetical protein
VRTRLSVVALVGVIFVLSAVVASAASAAQGPFYKVGGTRLAAGQSDGVTLTSNSAFALRGATLAPEINCNSYKANAGAELLGSSGANDGSGHATLTFEGCEAVTGWAGPCSIEGGTITTVPLSVTTAYATNTRTGNLYLMFKPVSKLVLAVVHLGGRCEGEQRTLEGAIAAEVFSGGKAVEAGKEPAEAASLELKFPSTSGRSVWTETAGTMTAQTTTVKAGGNAYGSITGSAKLGLAGGAGWGVFTK